MATLSDLPKILSDAGYERDALAKIGAIMPQGRAVDPVAVDEVTAEPTKPNIIARLLYMARSVPRHLADMALGSDMVDLLITNGLMATEGDQIRATCAMVPTGGSVMLRDFEGWATGKPLASDHVLGVGLASLMLSDFTVRRKDEKVLDLGTGQGYQATMACRHAKKIIATDINKRALHLAKLAMQINSEPMVELREGSMFDPVAGEEGTFDLLVSNPPFVIAPPHDLTAIGGRWTGDSFVEKLLRTAPSFLKEGGWATVMCNWHHPTIEQWQERISTWLTDSGVDCMVIRIKVDSARQYATSWLREAASAEGEEAMAEAVTQVPTWLEYYKTIGVGAVSLGVVYMRKRTPTAKSPNWLRMEVLNIDHYAADLGVQVRNIFAAETLLRSLADESEILDHKYIISESCEVLQTLNPPVRDAIQRRWRTVQSVIRENKGTQYTIALDPLPLEVMLRLDGERTGRAVIGELAANFKADEKLAWKESYPFLVKMLRMGHLVLC
jgi:methylase of polypeptide subunit release factors